MMVSFIRNKYLIKINKEVAKFQIKCAEKWDKFGTPIIRMPEKRWSEEDLLYLIKKYSQIVRENVKDVHFSGTIYSDSLQNETPIDIIIKENADQPHFSKLRRIFTYAFEQSFLWNSLHSDEFGTGSYIEYQVVQIVGHMFGSDEVCKNITGFVTSGGTESLMLAMRSYRNWGVDVKCHRPGQSVIIASKSVHASIMKAGKLFI